MTTADKFRWAGAATFLLGAANAWTSLEFAFALGGFALILGLFAAGIDQARRNP